MAFQKHKDAYQVLGRGAYLESSSSMTALGASTTVSVAGARILRIATKLPNLDVYILGYRLV